MKKTLSLLLSGAMALGLALPSGAAPLARWNSADNGDVRQETFRTVSGGESRNLDFVVPARKLKSPGNMGIQTVTSPVVARNRKALRSATAASRVSSKLAVYGSVIYNNTWTTGNAPYGIYQLPVTAGGSFTQMIPVSGESRYSVYDDENLVYHVVAVTYGSWVFGADVYVYDIETWTQVGYIEGDTSLLATDADIDPVTGKIYGCFTDAESYRYWGTADFSTGKSTLIADLSVGLRGVVFDKSGQAYGLDMAGDLYKITKETGKLEKIGSTGVSLYYQTSAAYDDKDNVIVVAYCNDNGAGLCEVDPETAVATTIVEFEGDDEVIGMFIPEMPADKAPDVPGLTVSCTGGSQDVDITVVLPAELFDGTDAAGETMHYTVFADGEEILSGDALAGETVGETKTLEQSGVVDFYAIASNDAGVSKKAKTSVYVGKGIPSAPKDVNLSYADGVFTLTWTAVTTSADNGYFDASAVRYDVVDREGETVASDLSDVSWTFPQAVPDDFTAFGFGVVARYDTRKSAVTMSNIVNLGHYNAPVDMDLTDAEMFSRHTVVDVNEDGSTWVYDNAGATYKYSKTNDADDWLFSPAVYLEAGKAYDFSTVARAKSNTYPEYLEIWIGNAANPASMTSTLLEKTLLTATDTTFPASIVPQESGEYFIGFHAVSEAYQYYIYLSSYQISEPYGATAPDAVTGLSIVPDVKGDLKAAISFKAATKSVIGEDFTGDVKIRVLRDGEEVKTVTVKKGTSVSVDDVVPAAGRYTYTVESYSTSDDAGRKVSGEVFIGPNVPNPPAAVKAVETVGKLGELTLSWNHATEDVDGNPLYAANLAYNVYLYSTDDEEWVMLNDEPVSDCSYTFQAQAEDAPQSFVQVGVQTVNKGVAGEYLQGAGLVAVGEPYGIPFRMSNMDDIESHIIGLDDTDGCKWGIGQDGQFSNVTSQDADGYFFLGERVGSGLRSGDLIFGKVDLAGAENPILSLYTWKITETDKSKLDVIVVCEGEHTLVSTLDYTADQHDMWTKKILDLSAFRNKTIQLILRYHSDGLVYFFLDNVQICDHFNHDLAATSITAPEVVEGGKEFEVSADVTNEGRMDAGEFAVELLADGEVVATETVASLEAGASTSVVFKQTINMAAAKEITYTARVVYDADLNDENDTTTKGVVVRRADSSLPVVHNLSGERSEDGNLLTWDAITSDDIPADPVTEDFESGDAFAQEFEGWTFVDADGFSSGGFRGIDLPDFEEGVDNLAFMVFDSSDSQLSASDFAAASGNMYIGSIYCMGEDANDILPSDDWAISPELNGKAQTVTFKGKNFSINYMEKIQVWYTTSNSVDPEDYEMLESFNDAGRDFRMLLVEKWKEFSFDLPEEALHFAIRVISDDGFMAMIDDVTFTPAGAAVTIEHLGYNVYCDGEKLNDQPLTTNTFTHSDLDDSEHTYCVTAVYNRGESEVSNLVTLSQSGVDTVSASNVKVSVEGRQIVVSGADGMKVTVVATDGKTIHTAEGDTRVDVLSGIYLVCVNRSTTKVVVR